MTLLVPERGPTPSIPEIHAAFCDRYSLEYDPARLQADFTSNAYPIAILLAPLISPFASPTLGFLRRHGEPLPRVPNHAWVNFLGRIIDPCQWVHAQQPPAVYEGESITPAFIYEECTYLKPDPAQVPPRGVGPSPTPAYSFHWEPKVSMFLRDDVFQDGRDVGHLNLEEITFLAGLPYAQLFPHLHAIYGAIIAVGLGHLVPETHRKYYYRLLGA